MHLLIFFPLTTDLSYWVYRTKFWCSNSNASTPIDILSAYGLDVTTSPNFQVWCSYPTSYLSHGHHTHTTSWRCIDSIHMHSLIFSLRPRICSIEFTRQGFGVATIMHSTLRNMTATLRNQHDVFSYKNLNTRILLRLS